ncbi:serine hydrolase [Agriterribacter sp.]|mgnify:CR=1 FL=1|uniref:serine hydrolase n=1 Tax=Agriterribacter sp. TaxID=2821509 RepID=UPI002CC8DE8D|nr:serine hydrolase [Agriterribacter sp.]HRO44476.1 serine hydrolase [Agriterribacter sp.]HRQ16498.1 serine hydrolase [Agriterribacter sp.]
MKALLSLFITIISITIYAQTKEEKLHQLMEAYFNINKLNGSVLVTQNGKILLNRGYGLRSISDSLPNDTNTVFQVGSLTKQFTATVILKLEEMKKLNVTDKLSRYFPDYPNGDSITIENLLNHTSGIFNYTDDKVFMQTAAMKPVTQEIMLASFKNKLLKFTPGSNWEYSNSNYILLGYIIEKITKKPYEKVVQEMIFNPLKMTSSGFNFSELKSDNKAKGYMIYSKEGGKESLEFDPTVSYAAGAMYTTTSDLSKWQKGISLYKIISRASFDRATTPNKNNYGYGNYTLNIDGKKLIAHGGLTFGYSSYLGRIDQDDISIVILNNIVNTSINDIAKDVLDIVYDKPYRLPETIKEVTLSPEILNRYIGSYQVAPQVSIAITVENGQLFGQATGQDKILLTPQKEDFFFIRGADVQIEFKKDSSGIVAGLFLIDGGKKIDAKKMQ